MSAKPVIFISYSHKDEPDEVRDDEVKWLTYVQKYLAAAVKDGRFEVWVDRNMPCGTGWDAEIERNLHICDVFVLLVSENSTASDYILDKEIKITRERQGKGQSVHFYPILLKPTPEAGLRKVTDKNLRPRDGNDLWNFPPPQRAKQMKEIADEIAELVEQIGKAKTAATPPKPRPSSAILVDISKLPETPYVRLVGRDDELARLDAAWVDPKIDIISAIAEGGAGKSALVNEWLARLQARNYGGAEEVLGWSFYSQGSKQRATSADSFLNWALDRLKVAVASNNAEAKGEAIAEALANRRILLVLDGVEPLQHGLGPEFGKLKDPGLRALLRRYAAMPPSTGHSLIVVTSRAAIADLAKWKATAAPIIDLDKLSDDAGADLLKDNGVWGTDKDLKAAVTAFGGHALALSLLAGYLKEAQNGDVRRRDHIRGLLADADNPRHDHATRVMESISKEWLGQDRVLNAIMNLIGLFDRPADAGCLNALRRKPEIEGLTEPLIELSEEEWNKSVNRLRAARLLLPADPKAPDALDAHPLVREWFGERLRQANEAAWRASHGRLYEHLRDTTKEGKKPTLDDLAPLYQAIPHGCRAGRHQEALKEIYMNRICRARPDGRIEFYATKKLGAFGSDLAAIFWFFDKPYETPVSSLVLGYQSWVLGLAGYSLRAQGRFSESLLANQTGLRMDEDAEDWSNAAITASNLSETQLVLGEVVAAIDTAARSVKNADCSKDYFQMMSKRTTHADALHAAGQRNAAERLFADAEQRQREQQTEYPLLYSIQGYQYCDLLIAKGDWTGACDRAIQALELARAESQLLDIACNGLTLGRVHLALALHNKERSLSNSCDDVRTVLMLLDGTVEGLRAAGQQQELPRGLLSRAAFRRSIADWKGATRDLDEVEEIAEPGPMRLHLCDLALERARLDFAHIEAFAPLNGLLEANNPPKPTMLSDQEITTLREDATKQLAIASDLIAKCGYHRRDEELTELQFVLRGERHFADLPPRV
ncbi:MAG: toll/interleukin-1 receptor domain-containing protein [Rhizomicrobium sp.]